MESLSASQARRIALAAQGFAERRPTGRLDRRHARRLFDRVGLIQIDSVNVLVRSQELPVLARLGPHRRDLLPSMALDGELFEYWGHEASLIPTGHHHLFRWKMERAAAGAMWGGLVAFAKEHPGFIEDVLAQVKERGPVTAGDLRGERERRRGSWWDWDSTKRALELLYWTGQVAVVRLPSFERAYDLPERVLPPEVLAQPTPPEREARRQLIVLAAHSLGVATVGDLADYHRQKTPSVRPLVPELVEEGLLTPVQVDGWGETAYLAADARLPRSVRARALLSPFDSVVWRRERTERLFDFRYRIEIYTPAPKRVYGYYVLPFLLGDRLVARVDLKADRAAGVLRANAAHTEPGVDDLEVAEALAAELAVMAGWLGLGGVVAGDRGDLAPALATAVSGAASA